MIKKILIIIFLVNTIGISFFLSLKDKDELKKAKLYEKNIVDIKNSNDLINTYSNLIKEIVPANAKQ